MRKCMPSGMTRVRSVVANENSLSSLHDIINLLNGAQTNTELAMTGKSLMCDDLCERPKRGVHEPTTTALRTKY